MKRQRALWLLVAALLALLLAACGNDDSSPKATEPPAATPTPAATDTPVPPTPTPTPSPSPTPLPLTLERVPITAANARGVGPMGMLGRGSIDEWVWSPDGRTMAVVSDMGIWLFDAADFAAEPRLLAGHTGETVIAFSADGRWLASGGGYLDDTVRLWDVASGTPRWVVASGTGGDGIDVVAISPDGSLVASGGDDGVVRLWDAQSGELRSSLIGHRGEPRTLLFLADGTLLASADRGEIRLWDLAGEAPVRVFETPDLALDVTLSADGSVLLAHVDGGRMGIRGTMPYLIDAGMGQQMVPFDDPEALQRLQTFDAVLTPDGPLVAGFQHPASSEDRELDPPMIGVWNYATGDGLMSIDASNLRVVAVILSPDGTRLIVAAGDLEAGEATTTVWNVATGEQIASLSFAPPASEAAEGEDADTDQPVRVPAVRQMEYSDDGVTIMFQLQDGSLRLWDAATLEERSQFMPGPQRELLFDPAQTRLVTRDDGALTVWDVAAGEVIAELPFGPDTDYTLSAPDGGPLAARRADGTVEVWDAAGQPQPVLGVEAVKEVTGPGGMTIFEENGRINVRFPGSEVNFVQLHRHTSSIKALAVNADQSLLLSASDDGTVRVWDTATWLPIATLQHPTDVDNVGFSPDGTLIVSVVRGGGAMLWGVLADAVPVAEAAPADLPPFPTPVPQAASLGEFAITGANAASLEQAAILPGGPLRRFAWSADGSLAAVAGRDGIWLVTPGDPDAQPDQLTVRNTQSLVNVAISPDGSTLAAVGCLAFAMFDCGEGGAVLWDLATRERTGTFGLEGSEGVSVAYSPDGTLLAVGFSHGVIALVDPATGEEVRTLSGHEDAVIRVAFSPDGALLASAGEDKTMRLWDVATGDETLRQDDYGDMVTDAIFSPDGALLAIASFDGQVRLWDVAAGQVARTLVPGEGVYGLSFSADGAWLSAGSFSNVIRVWDVASGELAATLSGHTDTVILTAFSPVENTLASSSLDGSFRLWDLADPAAPGESRIAIGGHNDDIWALAFSPDGTLLASGGQDNSIRLWDYHTGAALGAWEAHGGVPLGSLFNPAAVRALAFTPDGGTLLSAGSDGFVRFWDASNGALLREIEGHAENVTDLAIHPDGTVLATAQGSLVRIWDMATGEPLHMLMGNGRDVRALAFNSDGSVLASASRGGSIMLWDTATWQPGDVVIDDWNGTPLSVDLFDVAFSPDDSLIAAAACRMESIACSEGQIYTWLTPPLSGDEPVVGWASGSGHESVAYNVTFTPDGSALLSTGSDGTLIVWGMPPDGSALPLLRQFDPVEIGSVSRALFSPDGMLLVIGNEDGSLRLWRATGEVAEAPAESGVEATPSPAEEVPPPTEPVEAEDLWEPTAPAEDLWEPTEAVLEEMPTLSPTLPPLPTMTPLALPTFTPRPPTMTPLPTLAPPPTETPIHE